MKRYLWLIVFVCLSTGAFAQKDAKDTPEFGKVSKEELQINSCEFDPGAAAMVIFDVAEAACILNLNSYNNPLSTFLDRHVRIKILNDKGLDHGNIKIRFRSYDMAEQINKLQGQTYNLDASGNIVVSKLEKDAIFKKSINKYYSEMTFTFPNVKAGSIIEYKYQDYSGYYYAIKNWYFQRNIPVQYTRYRLDFPHEIEVAASVHGQYEVTRNVENLSNRSIQTYSMKNVPALQDEPFMSSDEDYLQKLEPVLVAYNFPGVPRKNLRNTWQGLVKYLIEDIDFGAQLNKNLPRTDSLDAMLKKCTSSFSKMTTIFDYVRHQMVWNEYEGIFAFEGVKSAWKSKKGTSGEINLILVNLLKDAGIDANPVLVSTISNGIVNISIPDYHSFDKVMAFVELDEKTYVLDATNKFLPVNLIPEDVLYTEGLVIKKPESYDWGWHTLWDPEGQYRNFVFVNGQIKENGTLTGNVEITSDQYERLQRVKSLHKGKKEFEAKYLQAGGDVTISNLVIENETIDSLSLVQRFDFEKKLNNTGEYLFMPFNLFSDFEKNPFIADTRASDIYFGANQQVVLIGSYKIPDAYIIEAPLKNTRMIMPDTSIVFSRIGSFEEGVFSIRVTVDFKRPIFVKDDYPYFQEFYKKLFELLNEPLILKKK